MRATIEAELARLEEGMPAMVRQRDELTEQLLRVEGAIFTLRALLASESDKGAPVEEIAEPEGEQS